VAEMPWKRKKILEASRRDTDAGSADQWDAKQLPGRLLIGPGLEGFPLQLWKIHIYTGNVDLQLKSCPSVQYIYQGSLYKMSS
jgi:hypothetical protein